MTVAAVLRMDASSQNQMSGDSPAKAKDAKDEEPFYDFSKEKGKSTAPSAAMKKIENTLYWKDPIMSTGVFGAGLVWFYLTTLGGYTIISLVSIVLIVHMVGMIVTSAIAGFRGHDSTGGKAPQVDAEAVKKGIDAVVSVINDVLSWYYGLLGASNLMMALYVMGGLIVSWIVGSWFDLYTLLFFAFVTAFSVPVAYRVNKQVVDDALVKVQGHMNQAIDKVKAQIPRAGKAEDGVQNGDLTLAHHGGTGKKNS